MLDARYIQQIGGFPTSAESCRCEGTHPAGNVRILEPRILQPRSRILKTLFTPETSFCHITDSLPRAPFGFRISDFGFRSLKNVTKIGNYDYGQSFGQGTTYARGSTCTKAANVAGANRWHMTLGSLAPSLGTQRQRAFCLWDGLEALAFF